MKFLKTIIKSPIRNTVIILVISLVGYLLFGTASLYIMRVMCAASLDVMEACRGTSLQMLISMVLNDFELIFRIATELSIVVLISQFIYRLAGQKSK